MIERTFDNALAAEPLTDDRVMDELTENGQWLRGGELLGLGDGVADAETETETLSANDFHKRRLLCDTK